MSAKSAMMHRMAQKGGIEGKMVSVGPLGPNCSEEEWIKWLNYIPIEEQQIIDYLSNKPAKEMTRSEKAKLFCLQKELKMASISKVYGKEEISSEDCLEFINYTNQPNLDRLIRRKLTPEEYNAAIKEAKRILSESSFEELIEYCDVQEEIFESLSMQESLTFREVSKKVFEMDMERLGSRIVAQLDANERMRKRSIKNANRICR